MSRVIPLIYVDNLKLILYSLSMPINIIQMFVSLCSISKQIYKVGIITLNLLLNKTKRLLTLFLEIYKQLRLNNYLYAEYLMLLSSN